MIRQRMPADEKETENQNDREKRKRHRNPLTDRESPNAIVQPT
jgi:hypothetical protein